MTFDELLNSEIDIGTEQAGELQRRLKQVVQHTLLPPDADKRLSSS